jgi:hypothetical protein
MRLEIQEFEPSTVVLDGSQTVEPSNRLNRRSRRFSRRFVSRSTPPEDFSPFRVARWGTRPEHSPQPHGSPSVVIASRGDFEGGDNQLVVTMVTMTGRGRPSAGDTIERPDPAIASQAWPHPLERGAQSGAQPAAAPYEPRGCNGPLDECSTGPGLQGRRFELAVGTRWAEVRNLSGRTKRAGALASPPPLPSPATARAARHVQGGCIREGRTGHSASGRRSRS